MNSIVNSMGKYDHRQHERSDWLAELEQRFQLGQLEADRAKNYLVPAINWRHR